MDYVNSITSPLQSLLASLDSFLFGSSSGVRARSGLLNHGNTCFLNSISQSLASLSSFEDWMRSDENLGGQLHRILSDLLQDIHANSSHPCATERLFTTLLHSGWKRALYEQQDAHEFFQFLVSALQHERTKAHQQEATLSNLPTLPRQDRPETPGVKFSKRIGYVALNRSIAPLPFHGTIFTDITCSHCHTRKPSHYQSVLSLSLELPNFLNSGAVPLSRLISHYLQTSRVEMVECRKCALSGATGTTCAYKTCLGKIPQCLCIHLQRTQFHPYGFLYKTQTHVEFPLDLDLSTLQAEPNRPVLHSAASIGPCSNLNGGVFHSYSSLSHSLFKPRSLSSISLQPMLVSTSSLPMGPIPSRATYSLKSVVEHLGEDSSTGHYVSYCRLKGLNGWVLCSDETVRFVTPVQVKKSQAYMLFYERSPL